MKREHGSIHNEPAFQSGYHAPDPAEQKAGDLTRREEVDAVRDSITQEPHLVEAEGQGLFRQWLDERKSRCSLPGNVAVTIVAGLVGGPFSLIGAMFSGQQGVTAVFYIVLVGPIIEELLKQSGMIYLVERKPYRVFASWQFFVAAWISAFIFAAVENVMYVSQFASAMPDQPGRVADFAAFRWKVCTALHLCCATIAACGVRRVWKKQLETGQPADLSHGFPLIITAIAVHGIYNACALAFSDLF